MMKLVRCSPDFVYLKSCMCLALVLSCAQSLVGGSPQTRQLDKSGMQDPCLLRGSTLALPMRVRSRRQRAIHKQSPNQTLYKMQLRKVQTLNALLLFLPFSCAHGGHSEYSNKQQVMTSPNNDWATWHMAGKSKSMKSR